MKKICNLVILFSYLLSVQTEVLANPLDKSEVYEDIIGRCESVVSSRNTGAVLDLEQFSKRTQFPQLRLPGKHLHQTLFKHPSHETSIVVVERETDGSTTEWSCGILTDFMDDTEVEALTQWVFENFEKKVESGTYDRLPKERKSSIRTIGSCDLGYSIDVWQTRKFKNLSAFQVDITELSCPLIY